VLIGVVLLGKGLDDTTSTASQDDGSAVDDSGDGSGDNPTDDTTDSVGSPISPSEINVIVANGSGVADAAAAVSATLTGLGYTPLPPTNTTVDTSATPLDTVYYATSPDTQAQAQVVADDLGLADGVVQPYPGPDAGPAPMGLAQVLVVLGSSPNMLATSGAATTDTTLPAG
jgi:hypothetical protein